VHIVATAGLRSRGVARDATRAASLASVSCRPRTRRLLEEKKVIMEPTRLEQSTWLRFVLRGVRLLERPGRRLLRLNALHLLAAARRRTHLHD
jgi:hypothetical protein